MHPRCEHQPAHPSAVASGVGSSRGGGGGGGGGWERWAGGLDAMRCHATPCPALPCHAMPCHAFAFSRSLALSLHAGRRQTSSALTCKPHMYLVSMPLLHTPTSSTTIPKTSHPASTYTPDSLTARTPPARHSPHTHTHTHTHSHTQPARLRFPGDRTRLNNHRPTD